MRNKLVVMILGLIVFGISTYSSFSLFANVKATTTSESNGTSQGDNIALDPEQAEEGTDPRTEECPLNGGMHTKKQKEKWEKRRPLGVMIENSVDSRPQSGLSYADVVYEAVAEGGITRFLSVFYCRDAQYLGPVRSARIYFIRLIRGYGEYPLYAHVGGANCDATTGSGCQNGAKADALGYLRDLEWTNYNNLNQFSVPFPVFYRDYDRLPNVATEHTMYSSTKKLWDYAKSNRGLTNVDDKGVAWDKTFTKWTFADDAKEGDRGTVSTIKYGFWSSFASDFEVIWKYDRSKNTYLRTNGGKPHIDKNNKKQLSAKNVIVVLADEAPANDGYPGGHILYDLIGTGDAYIFQNGQATKGTWVKKEETDKMTFEDEDGKEIAIIRGPVWVSVLPTGNKVDYQ